MDQPPGSRWELWRQRAQRLRTRARSALPFAAGVVAAFLVLLLYSVLFPGPHQLTKGDVDTSISQAMASATVPPAFSARVYQVIRPSLVLIQVKGADTNGKAEHGLGSGVIIDDMGDILTSLHVVANSTEIQVTFADGTESGAEVTVSQPENDIAVLKAQKLPPKFVPATLGNPNAMHIGDEAFVVGNPFGLYGSMTSGVISGFNRSFERSDTKQSLKGLIQIDAAVNPGNSGGPLVNRNGEVVGIVAALLNPTEQDFFVGIGFAVPINVAGGAAGSPPD